MRTKKIGMALVLAGAMALTARAKTLWVDCTLADYAGHDGSTEALAFETIQEGVDAASAGDTVNVKEGVYRKGVTTYKNGSYLMRTRVLLNKTLTLQAVGDRGKTVIQGEKDPSPLQSLGLGPNAVRCLIAPLYESPVRIIGFTITGGASDYASGGGNIGPNCGGGVYMAAMGKNSTAKKSYIINCSIVSNVATRAGGLWGGTAIGCFFCGNEASTIGAGCRYTSAYNCVFDGRGTNMRAADTPNVLLNCTFLNCLKSVNCDDGNTYSNAVLNCLFATQGLDVKSAVDTAPLTARNCAIEGDFSILPNDGNETNFSKCDSLLISTATADWRPRKGGAAEGAGDPALVASATFVPEEYRNLDYFGNPRLVDGKVDIGAVQGAVEVTGGKMTFNYNPARGTMRVDGKDVPNWSNGNLTSYVYAVDYPVMWRMEAVPAGANVFWGFHLGKGWNHFRFPDAKSGIWQMPPKAGETVSVYPWYSEVQTWASPDGDDDYAGADIGSEAHPYKTLQKAVDSLPSRKDRPIVYAKKGDYDQGETFVDGCYCTNRLSIGRTVRVIAVEGPEKTAIVGAADPAGSDGCGTASIRCVAIKGGITATVEGFTLRDGTCMGNGSWGGAGFFSGKGLSAQAIDCVITNCTGMRASAAWGGWLQRCLVVGNHYCSTQNNAMLRNGYCSAMVAVRNDSPTSFCGYGGVFQNCTFFGVTQNINDGASELYDSIFHTAKSVSGITSPGQNSGCLYYNVGTINISAGTYLKADPKIVDYATGDFRLTADSPAIGAGALDGANAAKIAIGGFYGNPLLFKNGKVTIGASQRPVAVVNVGTAGAGTVEPSGRQVVEDGESLTVSASSGAERRVTGFSVDDVFHLAEGGARSFTWTAPALLHADPVSLDVVYGTNWYVNAESGNDANDGWTPETARQTLVAGVKDALAGDVVHAAAGVYAEGTAVSPHQTCASTPVYNLAARVVVPKGVTLQGENCDTTVIEGANATADQLFAGSTRGLGTNAVRGVYLEENAVLRGFTVRGGRTNGDSTYQDSNNMGGGVLGINWRKTLVEDCLLTNNCSVRGGAALYTTVNRCRILGNDSSMNGSGGRCVFLKNCFIDSNAGPQPVLCYMGLVNCVYGAKNRNPMGGADVNGLKFIANTVLMDGKRHSVEYLAAVTNVVLSTGTILPVDEKTVAVQGLQTLTPDEIAVDAGGRPQRGSLLIDAGFAGLQDELSEGAKDVYGTQRVYGGTIDIGCCEYDWRADFASALGGAGISVVSATPGVKIVENRVRFSEGDRIAGFWSPLSETRRACYTATVLAENGTTFGTFADAAGTFEKTLSATDGTNSTAFRLRNVPLDFLLGFSGTGFGEAYGFDQAVKGCLILLR